MSRIPTTTGFRLLAIVIHPLFHAAPGLFVEFCKIYAWQQVKMGRSCGRGKGSKACGVFVFPFFLPHFFRCPIWQAEQFPYKFNAPTGKRNVCPPRDPDYDLMHRQHKNCIKRTENYATQPDREAIYSRAQRLGPK